MLFFWNNGIMAFRQRTQAAINYQLSAISYQRIC